MACVTDAFSPRIRDTTAMIEVTATMLPSTVIRERSLALQIACAATNAESMNLFMAGLAGLDGLGGPDGQNGRDGRDWRDRHTSPRRGVCSRLYTSPSVLSCPS